MLTVTVSVAPGSIADFGGTISFDGITQAALGNFGNSGDLATLAFPGTTFADVVIGTTFMGEMNGVIQAGDNATVDLSAAGVPGLVPSLDLTTDGVGGFSLNRFTSQFTAAPVPEPSSSALLLGGLLLTSYRRR